MQNIYLTEKSRTSKKTWKYIKFKYQEQFWSCKFTANSNLNKKVENYKLKK